MTTPWKPLLAPPDAAKVRRAIDRLATGLPGAAMTFGAGRGAVVLDVGGLGQALFWAELGRHRGDETVADRAVELLDAACDELEDAVLRPSLFAGYLGPAWVAEHFAGMIFEIEEDEDPHEEIDRALLASLEENGVQGWDPSLVQGFVGCGVYALERLPRPAAVRVLERVVAGLGEIAVPVGPGIAWRTPAEVLNPELREAFPTGICQLGLARGSAGVIALLGEIARAGVSTERARSLVEAAVRVLEVARLDTEDGPALPMLVSLQGRPGERSPLSWCAGDPGIALAWLRAARAFDRPDWEMAALDLARTAARRPIAASGVADLDLCHGAAGVAHVFHRLYRSSGDDLFADAARSWLSHLLDTVRPDGETGFWSHPHSPHLGGPATLEPKELGGFLRGGAGIGLMLLAAIADVPPDWDRVLLLS